MFGMDTDAITASRREALAASIHSISAGKMTVHGGTPFPYHDDPWRETFFESLAQNRRSS